jgi:8-oxo-dGTP pyrophosphatase MutT (NUDIX family)
MEILDKELHRIAITCIVYNEERKYLVTRRSLEKKAFPGKWTVPGGGLNTDDYTSQPKTPGTEQWYGAVETALLREIREEVNIEVEKPKYLLDLTFIRPDNVPVLVLSYYAKYISGEIKLDEDSIEYRWVTVEEALVLDLIPGIYDEIKMVDDLLKNNTV